MKWTHPISGDQRTRRFFCWTPFRFANTSYWLQFVNVSETFVVGCVAHFWLVTSAWE